MTVKNKVTSRRTGIWGVGVNDSDYLTQRYLEGKKVICPFYRKWHNMLKRCYSKKYLEKYPSYMGCTVCDEWLKFSNFKLWMINQDWVGKHLDKDIIITGNKLYSPETCLFVDKEVNLLITKPSDNTTGMPCGVVKASRSDRFQAQCSINGRQKYLGTYDTKEEASLVYSEFKSNRVRLIASKYRDPLKGYLERISEEIMEGA